MEENQPPNTPKPKPKRPLFITVLALLHIIGGGVFFLMAIIGIFFPDYSHVSTFLLDDYLLQLGQTSWVLSAVYLVSSSLGFISGIGMLLGSKWFGWYLGTLYYAYNLFRNFNVFFLAGNVFQFLPHEILSTVQNPEYYFYQTILRIVIYSVIYIYFFTKNIEKYFKMDTDKKFIIIAVQFIFCIAISALLARFGG